jgi:glycosidase
MSAYTCALVNEYPQINIVGEEWSTNPIINSRWQKGNVLSTDLNSCLPSVFDFPLQATLVQSLLQPENWNSGLNNLYELIACDGIYPDPFNLVVFPDNHDMDRFFTQINEDLDLFKIGMTYIATTRGIPQFYYGTEILMSNPKTHDHGEIRSDFPGGWTGDTKNAFSGLNLSVKEKEAQDFTRSLLNFRKNSTALHSGQLMHYAPQNGVYVYFRYNETQKIMVVLNKSDKAESFTPLKYPEMLQGGENGFNVLTNDKIDLKSLSLMPKSAHIIQINP